VILSRLNIRNIRCLTDTPLEPADINLIHGENASGKTSLLEAIFLLGRGKSFRTIAGEGLIQDGKEEATVSGCVVRDGRNFRLGIGLKRGESARIRVDGHDERSAAVLAKNLPVQVIDPGAHRLIEEGPGVRRRFVDWGVFHVEHGFLDLWRRYHRTLRQRNAALKSGNLTAISTWNQKLADYGEQMSLARHRYIAAIRPFVEVFCETLLETPVEIRYRQGWSEERSLIVAIEDSLGRDRKTGSTYPGPHRADLVISLETRKARGRISRGQQKLLAASMVLGQLQHLKKEKSIRSILLLDDVAAELDGKHLGRFLHAVCSIDLQLFVTALSRDVIQISRPLKVFHVEQGKVSSVVQ
jgi:DNA replication and repair protein RecF